MCAQKIETYDVSPKQRRILEWRYARRIELRKQYLKESLNPSVQVMPMDTAVQRLIILRSQHEYISKIRLMPHLIIGSVLFGSLYLSIIIMQKVKGHQEHKYRTGQVSYVDREMKFV